MKDDAASLDRLHDIIVPPAAGWWPLTPGWWMLLAMVVLVGVLWMLRLFVRYQRNAYRREALAKLNALESSESTTLIGEVNVLLKRASLSVWPREVVASLSGQDWLSFLDRSGGTEDFTNGPGKVLEHATASTICGSSETDGLLRVAREWIQRHQKEVSE